MKGSERLERISYRVALGGIVAAFCLVGMFLTGVFPLLYLVFPMVAGLLLLIIVEEVGTQWAWMTYVTVSVLSLFVTYDKEAALIFIMFFGCFPIYQQFLNRIRPKFLCILVKLLIFNVTMVLYFRINVYVLGLEDLLEAIEDFGKYGGAVMLAMINPFFLMYDYSISGMCRVYREILKPRIMGRKR